MYTSFTSKNIITHSIENEFERNNISSFQELIKNEQLKPLELLINLSKGNVELVDHSLDLQNQWRANATLDMLQTTVRYYDLKNLNCSFIVNLDDGCHDEDSITRLTTVGRPRNSNHIGITDSLSWTMMVPYHSKTTFNLIKLTDTDNFNNKKSMMIFRGADTGSNKPNTLNQRIRMSQEYFAHSFIDVKITKFIGTDENLLQEKGIDKQNIFSEKMSPDKQLQYKYLLYLYGNCLSTDRTIWNLLANSLMVMVEPAQEDYHIMWYQLFMEKEKIIPTFSEKNFYENFCIWQETHSDLEYIDKQIGFGNQLSDPKLHIEYTKEVLLKYNAIYNS